MEHIPVLLEPILEMSHAEAAPTPKWYLDCTFGRGGHLSELARKFPAMRMVAIDRDEAALEHGKTALAPWVKEGRLQFSRVNFMKLQEEWAAQPQFANQKFDLILADLGVSSPQLDQAARGFSFYADGPLDMRMDQRQKVTAANIVNEWSEEELNEAFQTWGEIRSPQRVVSAIVHDRKTNEFHSTKVLAGLIERIEGWRKKGSHPATRFFLALRLLVNEELSALENGILDLLDRLAPHGRLMVISFHSSEDRIVKWTFKKAESKGKILTKKVIEPKWEETKNNVRARSAKLRVFERGEV